MARRVLIGIATFLIFACLALTALFRNEISTLSSLREVDEYPFYTMTYHGDYGFSEFLKTGAESDEDIERFIVKRLLKGVEIDLGIASAGCSAFTAQNSTGQRIYARNFDFDFAPVLLQTTTPSDGYASISIVNLAFAGYDEDYLPKPYALDSFLTLSGPYLPFDGMNEKGLVIALLAVPHAEPPNEKGKITLNTTTAIRLILDHASNLEEAIDLLEDHNIYFSGGVECHYLVSDANGDSAVIEFLENDIKITEMDKTYQVATNFIMYQGVNEGEGGTEFERYDTIDSKLKSSEGIISETEAMRLLSEVQIPNRTQWSVVYNQITGLINICIGANYDIVYTYQLDLSNKK